MEEESIKVSTKMTTGNPQNQSREDAVTQVLWKEEQIVPPGCTPGGKDHVEPDPDDPILNDPCSPTPTHG